MCVCKAETRKRELGNKQLSQLLQLSKLKPSAAVLMLKKEDYVLPSN